MSLTPLVKRAVLLDAGYAQSAHAAAVHRPLPTGELLNGERVAVARLIYGEEPTGNSGYDFCLSARNPAFRTRGRKCRKREPLAERADDLGRPDLLILEHLFKPV